MPDGFLTNGSSDAVRVNWIRDQMCDAGCKGSGSINQERREVSDDSDPGGETGEEGAMRVAIS